MAQIACLRCKKQIDASLDQCPHCSERVTTFQRTYSDRLLDGKYQIVDRLGVGGMGEIFKVRHIHLNELRVIKIMRPNVAADDQGLQRFLQEARTSTMIKHKNLAMLYDFAQLEDGSYYMVWEFIDGTNIQKWIAQNGPAPPRLTIEISVQALDGLEHLHSMGLIHRDISPENIMLSQDHHGKLLVKVIDFGIAKQLAEGESGHGLTQTGMFLGKLKYASPEQAGFLKEDEHLDARSDLYSFGIVMYEMLAGKAPFQATNPHGYILKHVTEKPAPISVTTPDVKIPAQLESIVMKSLEKSRDVRFSSAGEFADALAAIRESIPADNKWGLGEKLVTLSGAQTLADLPRMTGTFTGGGTQQRTAPGSEAATLVERLAPGTMSGAPTVAERTISPATLSDSPTLIERQIGSTPTAIERLDSQSVPTVIENKWKGGSAPTSTDRPARNKGPLLAAAAVAGVIVIGGGAYFFTRPKAVPAPAPSTAPAVASVTSTATPGAPLTGGQGALLLSASPWGDIEKIVNSGDHQPVALPDDAVSTPARITLPPGRYTVTLAGPGGTKTIDVAIEAGKNTPQHVEMGGVNMDDLVREMNP